MFARIEVGTKPDFNDPVGQAMLRKIELAHPEIRKNIRWVRYLEIYWLDLPFAREELIPVVGEIFWDKVMQWIFSGNLIPSGAGKTGGVQDLLEASPIRPGKFWALEKRFRAGVTDNISRTALEAFEIVLGKTLPQARAATGGIFLCEGPGLDEDSLAIIARDVFCNELIESWTILSESELIKNDRFHQERIKGDFPKLLIKPSDRVEEYALSKLPDAELELLGKKHLWALTLTELKAIQAYYGDRAATDVEMEVIAQTWSEHCKHKIFGAKFSYEDDSDEKTRLKIPAEIDGLFKKTIAGTTSDIRKPWLLSVFDDNAGIVEFDEEDAFCIKVETHNSPSALDPYGGALTGIVGVNRDILGCGLGAKPIFNTNVFCVAPPDYSKALPDRLLHPRRILDGIRRGVEHGGNKSGIPTINGALVFDERFLGKPLVFCGTVGFMPRISAGRRCEVKEIFPGDRICMVGGRIGKDGIHGATFSSLALDETSPTSAVQLGDPITQKRMSDFLLEARDLGLYRAITDNGAGGLSSSVGEMAKLAGGARMDVKLAKTKYPGLKPYELVISESQERMTLAVAPDKLQEFLALALRRSVEVSELGEFNKSGTLEIFYGEREIAKLNLTFLHSGNPRLELKAHWKGRAKFKGKRVERSFEKEGAATLLTLLSRPNIASKEWLIRQYDHEVQGTSVIKPLQTAFSGTPQAWSGPNDGGVVKPKPTSDSAIAIACGINTRLADIDPYLMAQASVDEAVRNVICVGADFGQAQSILALVDNFCWPDPVGNPEKSGWLVRACYGLRDAALALDAPLVSGKDSMKNDFKGKLKGQPVVISVPPTLLMTAVAKVSDVKFARSSDFKAPGDVIYLIGGSDLGLMGSEYHAEFQDLPAEPKVGEPNWTHARSIYQWLGSASYNPIVAKLRSLHDVSEGGVMVAIAESLLARGLGAKINLDDRSNPWQQAFGEGFHSFVGSVGESESTQFEIEMQGAGIPFMRLGVITARDQLEVIHDGKAWSLRSKELRAAWLREGYWE